ncbi:amino acid permease [Lebetimonas sp. JH292]|uniref:amino acid permease n=1 Tax=Lebetimonas sp. JH292 TaxID=990068 RepID=UPI0004642AEA|nr:amino acid permease [Lebetimonas sp. JH292]
MFYFAELITIAAVTKSFGEYGARLFGHSSTSPPIINMFFAVGLTFFAYQGFSVITNTIEDMKNSKKNILRAMLLSILIVMILYVTISITVLGNLPLKEVIIMR